MDERTGGDLNIPDSKWMRRQLFEVFFRRCFAECDGKQPASHHSVQTGFGASGIESGIKGDPAAGGIKGGKKGKALNVIEMEMGEKKGQVETLPLPVLHQIVTESDDSCPCINNSDLSA